MGLAMRTVMVDDELAALVELEMPLDQATREELVMGVFQVADGPLRWEVRGRCGFATDFAYDSDG